MVFVCVVVVRGITVRDRSRGSSEERLRQAVLIGRQDARTLYRRAN